MRNALMSIISLFSYIKAKTPKGFTLMEMATVMVVLGLIAAPAAGIYHQHRVEKDWDTIEQDISDITNRIGVYRAIYGRYPCPSPANAVPGDDEYGFEFSAGSCATSAPAISATCDVATNGICAYQDPTSNKTVLVGVIPYKTLNLQEQESFDTFKNHYLYAVTLNLVDSSSFNMADGGISVVEKNNLNQSLVNPPGSAHFVVLSHGKNKSGGISRSSKIGAQCSNAPIAEIENCDNDSVFADGAYDKQTFDDRVSFYTSVTPSEWQISTDDAAAIHLKNTDSVAIGVNMSTNLNDQPETYVRSSGTNLGIIYASDSFTSEKLCKAGTTNPAECFEPELIAGELHNDGTRFESETAGAGGMSCYKPSLDKDEYMVGIAEGKPLCSDEIYIVCPADSFIKDIKNNGEIACEKFPENWCEDENIITSCKDPAMIKKTYSGGYISVYSGECRNLPEPQRSYNASYFEAQINAIPNPTINDIKDMIKDINDPDGDGSYNDDREIVECGKNYNDHDTQVRDTYYCKNGSWKWHARHERGYYNSSWGWRWAEVGWDGPDLKNNAYYHDCWCREDYRVRELNCPDGSASNGKKLLIERHPCPQTYHSWEFVYDTDIFCDCAAGNISENMSCNKYYDLVVGTSGTTGLSGTVKLTYGVTCDETGQPVVDKSLTSTTTTIDTSNCRCRTRGITIDRTYCPTATTNEWNWRDRLGVKHYETAVESVHTKAWICPPGVHNDSKGNLLPEPGYYGNPKDYTGPSCNCTNTSWRYQYKPCNTFDKKGGPLIYKQYWDCEASPPGWDEDENNWEFYSGECHECRWQEGSGPNKEEYAYGASEGHIVNSLCSCNNDTTTQFCTTNTLIEGQYDVWTNCPCVEQIN